MEPLLTHIQFSSIGSTQKFLLGFSSSKKNFFLISSINQTSGLGRRGNKWQKFDHGLSFSFNLPIQEKVPLSLHLGNVLIDYFKENFKTKLLLKWPNDLYTEDNKKCGGILTQRKNNMDYIGIGININISESKSFGHLHLKQLSLNFQHRLPREIHQYILDSNKTFSSQKWLRNCIHLNREVELVGDEHSFRGTHTGINENGAIQIKTAEGFQTFQAGSLRLL